MAARRALLCQGPEVELFDLEADAGETRNLAPAKPELRRTIDSAATMAHIGGQRSDRRRPGAATPRCTSLEEAEEHDAAFIVIDSHGHRAFFELVVGSTTQTMLKRARRDPGENAQPTPPKKPSAGHSARGMKM